MKTKIIYNRDVIGRFDCDGKQPTKMKNFKKFMKKVGYCTVVLGLVAIVAYISPKLFPEVRAQDKYTDISKEALTLRINLMKDQVVDEIMSCESQGAGSSLMTIDPPKIQTATNIMSYGKLQFKVDTVIGYVKLFEKRNIASDEAIAIAFNQSKAHDLAKRIMFETPKMAGDWRNCANSLDTNKKIQVIKQIEVMKDK